MRSSAIVGSDPGTAVQYNNLRSDSYGGSMLLAHQEDTPGMTAYVEAGVFFVGGTKVTFAGGSTGTFTAPTSNPRIDLIGIDTNATLQITAGTEASSPSIPSYPAGQVIVAEVHHVTGEAILYDNANQTSGQGYLVDVRPFLQAPANSNAVNNTSNRALGTAYMNDSGRMQINFITLQLVSQSGQNPFASITGGMGVGQAYYQNEYSASDTMKTTVTYFVPPGLTVEVSSGGTGIVTLIDWYTLTL